MSKKHLTSCSDCRYQMSGFDGGFGGLPFTCECRIFGETEDRENCRKFEKKITRNSLFDKIYHLEKENEQLRKDKKVLDEDNTDKQFQIRKQEQKIKKLQEINEELSEKIKELSFNDYKRCLEIINHQRILIQKIEELTGQTIEDLIINLDKGVEME